MKDEWIKNHFLINDQWKTYFLSKFPNWNKDTWENDVWCLFEQNGYKYHILKFKHINAVKYITLYDPTNDDIVQLRDLAISSALQQLLIHVITEFQVDFTTFS